MAEYMSRRHHLASEWVAKTKVTTWDQKVFETSARWAGHVAWMIFYDPTRRFRTIETWAEIKCFQTMHGTQRYCRKLKV